MLEIQYVACSGHVSSNGGSRIQNGHAMSSGAVGLKNRNTQENI